MFILRCLPFSKGLKKDFLSYFSAKRFEPGSVIKINVNGKLLNALVTGAEDASEAKSEIKSAGFRLKKISSSVARPFLQKEFLEAIKETAEYFVATEGSILSLLIPSVFFEKDFSKFIGVKSTAPDTDQPEGRAKSEISALQVPDEERFIHYRSLIREEFAKKKSVFLCCPQNEDVKRARENPERGIESFVYVFHGGMNEKELKKNLSGALSNPHPVLVIGTPRWLFLPRSDFGTIILDKENENGWINMAKPFIDSRMFAEILASKRNTRLLLGDSILRTETLYRYKQGMVSEFESVKWRLPEDVDAEVVDLKKRSKKEKVRPSSGNGEEFSALSPEALGLLRDTAEKGTHMFLFASRKGLSSLTVCRDCGEPVRCFNCSSPMILYRVKTREDSVRENMPAGIFKCHQCGETRDAAEFCRNCQSWRLAAFGAGIDRVSEEIKKKVPEIKIFEIHKDATSTGVQALKIAKGFYETRGSVLLGTEMAFSYLHKKVANSAIASFDSLFSIPDFRVREKIFRLILQSRNIAKEKFLIQTRNPGDETVSFALTGNLLDFYKKEIRDREPLGYPPFGTFIKITCRGDKNFVSKEAENLKNALGGYSHAVFNSIHEKKGEQSAVNAVIKLEKEKWPNPELCHILKSLPPFFEIKVDPDNLL